MQPRNSFPECISEANKMLILKDKCTLKFTAALFIIAKIWMQRKCLLAYKLIMFKNT